MSWLARVFVLMLTFAVSVVCYSIHVLTGVYKLLLLRWLRLKISVAWVQNVSVENNNLINIMNLVPRVSTQVVYICTFDVTKSSVVAVHKLCEDIIRLKSDNALRKIRIRIYKLPLIFLQGILDNSLGDHLLLELVPS
jgi:hypothetical protein